MIVPQFWAEARRQHRDERRQITLRRFGWSDVSEADAQAKAERRVQEALARVLEGERLPRREPKVPYNGAEGVPIREEVVSRQGEVVLTRNVYGARCLNTPNVLFADVDLSESGSLFLHVLVGLLGLIGAALIGWLMGRRWLGIGLVVLFLFLMNSVANGIARVMARVRGNAEQVARRRLARFLRDHAEWSVRVYRTPAGLRLLVTHALFSSDDPEVEAFFRAVSADPMYVRMCKNQRCFRARLTAKPWRIGIATHMRPRPGVWPVHPERRAERQAWIDAYEEQASAYAACHYEETVGSEMVHAKVAPVLALHDRECRALDETRPLA